MKFLKQHDLYDNNNHAKFQGQKIHGKKVIQNLPTLVVVVESFSLLPIDNLSKIELFFVCHEILGKKNLFMLVTYGKNFKAKKLILKYILTIYQHV